MRITQISVFLENKPGRLAYLLKVLSDAGVNLQALSVADTSDFGIVRLIVAETEVAVRALQQAGMTAATNKVLRVEIPDVPGGLARTLLGPLAEAGVNIEYTYAYGEHTSGKAIVVLKVDNLDTAEQALASSVNP